MKTFFDTQIKPFADKLGCKHDLEARYIDTVKEPRYLTYFDESGKRHVEVEAVGGEHVIWKIKDNRMKRVYDKQILRTKRPF